MNPSEDMRFLCRLCGEKTNTNNRINIFDASGISLQTRISQCLDIDVNKNDQLPKFVCTACTNSLESFYKFKVKSHETSSMLQSLLLAHNMSLSGNKQFNYDLVSTIKPPEVVYVDTLEPKFTPSSSTEELINKDVLSISDHVSSVDHGTNSNGQIIAMTKSKANTGSKKSRKTKLIPRTDSLLPPIKKKTPTTSTKVLTCDLCLKSFINRRRLHAHVTNHLQRRKFSCNHCTKKFKSNTILKQHLKVHEKRYGYICNYCGKGFYNEIHFETHIATNHTKVYTYQCSKCDKKYPNKYILSSHERSAHNNTTSKYFNCNKCKKSYLTQFLLEEHMKSHNKTGLDEKKFICVICNSSFKRNYQLKVHLSNHTGEIIKKNYECDICKKQLKSRTGVQAHLLTHTGVRDFVCDFCGKAFALKNNLEIHRLIHIDVRKFKCNDCNKSFTQRSSLNRHRKSGCLGNK